MSLIKSIPILLIIITCVWCGCVKDIPQDIPHHLTQQSQTPEQHSAEMQNLIDFLEIDQTSDVEYYDDPHQGIDYYVCAGFVRSLAKNATEAGIPMGGISLRNTPGVGPATKHYHAMNYVIIDNRFIIIEPQGDKIFTLETIKLHHDSVYRYITIFQDSQMMTNYGKHKETINIDLYGNYNESEIIKKFLPL